jgi:multicomponent Na+:H+ antiporter subunit E
VRRAADLLARAAALAVVYVMTLASTDPIDLATGLLIGAALLLALARMPSGPDGGGGTGAVRRALWFPVFAWGVLLDILTGTVDVAARVLHLRPLDRPGIVRVPIGDRTERGVAISALATTLSPGSVLLDVDHERGDLLLHVIDASDPDGVRDRHQHFYERYQRRVFP